MSAPTALAALAENLPPHAPLAQDTPPPGDFTFRAERTDSGAVRIVMAVDGVELQAIVPRETARACRDALDEAAGSAFRRTPS